MNRLAKRELNNLNLLMNYLVDRHWAIFYWSFCDGICRRLKLKRLYKITNKHRYDACRKYLKKRYNAIIEKYRDIDFGDTQYISDESTIWVFWNQGLSNLPYPLEYCINSIKIFSGNHEVVVLDEDNYRDYVEIPAEIEYKFTHNYISPAHFSDILRVELLKKHGGIWLDSTYLFTSQIEKLDQYKFFSICNGGLNSWVASRDIWSVSFLASAVNSPLMRFCSDMELEYWKRENYAIGYLLLDCIIAIAYDEFGTCRFLIDSVPVNNIGVFDLIGEEKDIIYDPDIYKKFVERAYVHKLTYKEMYHETVHGKLTVFGKMVENLK